MAFVTPTNVTVGSVLTASKYNQEVVENTLAGGPIFTTAAARDAAITAPYEGQRAYLTAPAAATVTATGAITAIPTGITTIYNGSVWVCTTPVGANSNTGATTTSTSYVTTLTGDATAISVTLPTGTTALITETSNAQNSGGVSTFLSFSVSGATTLAAADAQAAFTAFTSGSSAGVMARSYVYSGLTAGVNTFTLNYKAQAATATYVTRQLTVTGVA